MPYLLKDSNTTLTIILFIILGFCSTDHLHAQCADTTHIIYVDSAATGSNNGHCWANAFIDLQDALSVADSGNQIWVADGVYLPDDQLTDWYTTFNIVDGVQMYGGFAGHEDSLHQRNIELNPTVLSADFSHIYGFTIKAYTVMNGNNLGPGTIIDGFTITGSDAKVPNLAGGMILNQSSCIIRNCLFTDNRNTVSAGLPVHDFGGGAILSMGGSPAFVNCTFESNICNDARVLNSSAGGLFVNSDANIINCEFQNNSANASQSGVNISGALTLVKSSVNVEGTIFRNNYAQNGNFHSHGSGAILSDSATTTISDCIISNNTINFFNNFSYSAGGILTYRGQSTIISCRVDSNIQLPVEARTQIGGGIMNHFSDTEFRNCEITNNRTNAEQMAAGVYNIDATARFIKCKINNNTGIHSVNNSYSSAAGGFYNLRSQVELYQSEVRENYVTTHCLFETRVGGGFVNDSSGLKMVNSLVSNNTGHTTTTSSQVFSGGGVLQLQDTVKLFHSTLANNFTVSFNTGSNSSAGGAFNLYQGILNTSNSLIHGNRTNVNASNAFEIRNNSGSITSQNNLFEFFQGNSTDISGVNPDFIQADTVGSDGSGDYRLCISSPAINMGNPTLLQSDIYDINANLDSMESWPLDLDSTNRFKSTGVDLGVYENDDFSSCGNYYTLSTDNDIIGCSDSFPFELSHSDFGFNYILYDAENHIPLTDEIAGNGQALLFVSPVINAAKLEVRGYSIVNRAMPFNGVNQSIEFTHDSILNIADSFSIALWLKVNSDQSGDTVSILQKGGNYPYAIQFVDGSDEVIFKSTSFSGTNPSDSTAIPLNDTLWHYIAYTYDGSVFRGYKDGNEVFSLNRVFQLMPDSNSLYIGKDSSASEYFKGQIDLLRIWNYALNKSHLQNESTDCINSKEKGLILRLDFENVINPAFDSSPNNLNGTYVGPSFSFASPPPYPLSNSVELKYTPDTSGQIIYVNHLSTEGLNNGFCWGDAFVDLQDAIASADSGKQIWVAEGNYYPTPTNDVNISFELPNSVQIFGGFQGVETELSQRNWIDHPTVLSGAIHPGVQSRTVVKSLSNDSLTLLDGFIIQDGNSNTHLSAGGILTDSSFAHFYNCRITNNESTPGGNGPYYCGGGAMNKDGSPTYFNCIFSNNRLEILSFNLAIGGGGMMNFSSNTHVVNSTFSANQAIPFGYTTYYAGGGIATYQDNSQISNSIIYGNTTFAAVEQSDILDLNSALDVEYCLLEEYMDGDSSIVGMDPYFLSNGTFAVADSSPAVDAGTKSKLPPDIFDLDGNGMTLENLPYDHGGANRVQGCFVDMGAFESFELFKSISGTPISGDYYSETFISSNATILNPRNVKFQAVNSIHLNQGFEVEFGAEFEALIGDCPHN